MGLVGAGQAEMTGLPRQHINLAKQQITFFRQKTKTPYPVPVYPQAEALVKKLMVKPGRKPTDHLLPVNLLKSESKPGHDQGRYQVTSCHMQASWLPGPSLRRMFITRFIELGIDVQVIARWQGHQDGGKLILGAYSHVRNVHAEEMAKQSM